MHARLFGKRTSPGKLLSLLLAFSLLALALWPLVGLVRTRAQAPYRSNA